MKETCVVAALYCFVKIPNTHNVRNHLLRISQPLDVKGTLLVAHEGINGTIAGSRTAIDEVMAQLHAVCDLTQMEYKESFAHTNPFLRMKVKLKKEIVTLGVEKVDPTVCVGTYVQPEDWNALIQDPDVLLIDTRNDYEYAIGTFEGAVDPQTETFRQFPDYVADNLSPQKHKKVAMFCTGGIRCEKASAYMLEQGFEEVYHLKGGILKYLERVPEADSLWRGECFVFDERVAVKHGLTIGQYQQCYGCRYPIHPDEMDSADYVKGVSCPRCVSKTSPDQKQRFRERQKQIGLAKDRGEAHLGEV